MGPKPAPPPRPPARPGARGAAADGGGKSWLTIIGGLAILAGVLGLIYKLYIEQLNCHRKSCPKIDPKVRKWPIDDKSWIPWSKIKNAWSSIMKHIKNDKPCPLKK